MNKIRITVKKIARCDDLIAEYENPIEHVCPMKPGQEFTVKLNGYLADLNEQAEDMFFELVKQLAAREGVTEQLKVQNQMLWVQRMNNISNQAREIVSNEVIYTV